MKFRVGLNFICDFACVGGALPRTGQSVTFGGVLRTKPPVPRTIVAFGGVLRTKPPRAFLGHLIWQLYLSSDVFVALGGGFSLPRSGSELCCVWWSSAY